MDWAKLLTLTQNVRTRIEVIQNRRFPVGRGWRVVKRDRLSCRLEASGERHDPMRPRIFSLVNSRAQIHVDNCFLLLKNNNRPMFLCTYMLQGLKAISFVHPPLSAVFSVLKLILAITRSLTCSVHWIGNLMSQCFWKTSGATWASHPAPGLSDHRHATLEAVDQPLSRWELRLTFGRFSVVGRSHPIRTNASSLAVTNNSEFHNSSRKCIIREILPFWQFNRAN